jgi:hypothetical protein
MQLEQDLSTGSDKSPVGVWPSSPRGRRIVVRASTNVPSSSSSAVPSSGRVCFVPQDGLEPGLDHHLHDGTLHAMGARMHEVAVCRRLLFLTPRMESRLDRTRAVG